MTKLTAEQRVQKSHVALMNDPKYCLYSGIFMLGKTEVSDDIPTAATDGRNTYYGRKFVDSLPDNELKGLILHENLHKAFRHTTVWKHLYKQNKQAANMACDYVINLKLVDQDNGRGWIRMPKGGLVDTKYRGMDAKQIFDLLEDEDGDGEGEGGEGGKDGKGGRPVLSESERQAIKDEFKEALLSAAQASGAGNLPGGLKRLLKDLTEPKIDWREFIRQQIQSTVKNDYTYAIPSRKNFQNGFALPSMLKQTSIDVCIGVDTSGSITDEMARDFFTEVKAIMDTFEDHKIHLWCWDTSVHNPQEFTSHGSDDIMDYELAGFGGTDPTVCWRWMKEEGIEPKLLLMFTDGEIWGDWCPPGDENYTETVWIINNRFNKDIQPSFGRYAYYDAD